MLEIKRAHGSGSQCAPTDETVTFLPSMPRLAPRSFQAEGGERARRHSSDNGQQYTAAVPFTAVHRGERSV